VTLTPFYPSENDDANGCFVSEPLNWLAKLGDRNSVLAVRPVFHRKPRGNGPAVPAAWLRYFSLPGGLGVPTAGAFLFARLVGQLRELNRTQRVDLIHAHGALPCGHAAMLLTRELNIPYVVSVYGVDDLFTIQASGHVAKWCRRISQRVFAESRRVVCASEDVRESLLEGLGRGCRTSVVYSGVDPELFSPAPDLSNPSPTVLSGGNLNTIEGHDLLIRAAASLVKEFPALSLEIMGDGPGRSRLQALAEKLNLAGQMRFVGHQSTRRVADTMKRCTLFVLPSRSGRLECLCLNAMSCGKPVIGCRGQGIAEIVQHGTNGFLVGAENEKELTLAMGILLREPQRRRSLGAAARDTILDRFTAEQQAQNLRRIYREVVA
jgi:teichuronic acid biosynthesis glycosyltransferase TuaC